MNWRQEARQAAKAAGIDPDVFERQINRESGFAEDVITGRRRSSAGALGIAQIMPETAKGWGVDPLKPKQALRAAARAMAKYVKDFGGYEGALRAYNAGPGNVEASKGFSETNAYVQAILQGKAPKAGSGGARSPQATKNVTIPGATLHGIGEQGPSELDAVMGMLQGKLSPLQMAMEVKAARDAPNGDVKLPDTKIAVPQQGGGGSSPSKVKLRGDGLADAGSEMNAFARRIGLQAGGGPRSAQHNAEVGGAEDSDHLEEGYGRDRWAQDYPLRGEDALQAKQARIAKRYGLDPNDGFAQGEVKIGKHTYRVQVIAGAAHDHDDHVHVGFRLVR